MSSVQKYLAVYLIEVKCAQSCNATELPVKFSKGKMFVNLLDNKGILNELSLSYFSLVLCTSVRKAYTILSGEASFIPALAFEALYIFLSCSFDILGNNKQSSLFPKAIIC